MRTIVLDGEQSNYTVEEINGKRYITITDKIEIDMLDFEQRVKIVLFLNNMSQYELCKRLNVQPSAFSSRCKTSKFTFDDQRTIADAMGCKSVAGFAFDDGFEYIADANYQFIKDACEHANMSLFELSKRLGITKQAVYKRLASGRYSDHELSEMASIIGCVYYNYFELKDGTRI